MTRSVSSKYAFLFTASILAFLAPQLARAQSFSFGRAANEPWSGRITVINKIKLAEAEKVFSDFTQKIGTKGKASKATSLGNSILKGNPQTVELRPFLDEAWAKARQPLANEMQHQLREKNIGGGIRTSRNTVVLGEHGELFVGWDGRGFTLRFVLRGNSLTTSLRIPGPTPSGLDPRFKVNFDVDLLMDVDIHGTTLVAGSPRVRLNVHRPEGKNITGSLVLAIERLVSVISGTDIEGTALKVINSKEIKLASPINLELAKLSPALAKATDGISIRPGFDKNPNRITMTLEKLAPLPVVR
jgi:hypothetical protein